MNLTDNVIRLGKRFLDWVKGLTKSKKQALAMGAGVIAFAAMAGGPLLQYAFGGILVNSLFWMLVTDSPTMMKFMKKHGGTLDIVLTIGSFFTGGGTLGGWLTNLMGTGFFTLFRKYLAEDDNSQAGIVERIMGRIEKALKKSEEQEVAA